MALAGFSVVGAASGLRQLKNDVHLAAFPNAHCFPAGTPIATEFGLRPIESVQENDRVWSFDLITGQWELCRVAETYERDHEGDLVEVFVGGSATESTYHHPYWVVEGLYISDRPEPDHVRAATVRDAIVPGRWVDAGDLRISDVLLLQDGRREPITEILLRHAACRVYNLAVEGLRNYAVGAMSVLAHNNCGVWKNVNESMSSRARAYEQQITGRSGQAYFVNNVKFDGVAKRVLIYAKGPRYANFVKNGQFREWFRGAKDLVKQAENQIRVANGTPIRWNIAEADAVKAIRKLSSHEGITGIDLVHTPFVP